MGVRLCVYSIPAKKDITDRFGSVALDAGCADVAAAGCIDYMLL